MQGEGYTYPVNPAEHAKEVLAVNEINLKNFKGVYSDPDIQRDINEAKRLELIFEKSASKKYGDILEAIILEHGELSDWLGSNYTLVETAPIDDYQRGIDVVVVKNSDNGEFDRQALGIDVTYGQYDLHEKFVAIRKNMDDGKLGSIKYFFVERSNGQSFAGHLENIPQVVAGVEIGRVTELALLWMNPKKKKEMAMHPAQMTLLEETALELETFAEYAAAGKKPETRALVPILKQKLEEIKKLIREKRAAGIKGLPHDAVFEEIKRNLLHFYVTPSTPPAKPK